MKKNNSLKHFKGEYEISEKHLRMKRVIAVFSFAVFLAVMIILTVLGIKYFRQFKNPDDFADYAHSFGFYGWMVVLGLQILQVVVALIPGEAVEIGSGFAFGTFAGTILCLVGVTIGSALIFMLTKKWGLKLTSLFVKPEKLQRFTFLENEKRLTRLVFILYLIPGTPKDLLTYIVGLTKMKLGEFLLISLIARLPSVISSTFGGSAIADGNYVKAGIIFVVTAVISVAGLIVYNYIIKKRNLKEG